jgi:hypothetical protein
MDAMSATPTKLRKKKPQVTTGPDLETVAFEEGVRYLMETYAMRRDDAESYLQQIKDSVQRDGRSTA